MLEGGRKGGREGGREGGSNDTKRWGHLYALHLMEDPIVRAIDLIAAVHVSAHEKLLVPLQKRERTAAGDAEVKATAQQIRTHRRASPDNQTAGTNAHKASPPFGTPLSTPMQRRRGLSCLLA